MSLSRQLTVLVQITTHNNQQKIHKN